MKKFKKFFEVVLFIFFFIAFHSVSANPNFQRNNGWIELSNLECNNLKVWHYTSSTPPYADRLTRLAIGSKTAMFTYEMLPSLYYVAVKVDEGWKTWMVVSKDNLLLTTYMVIKIFKGPSNSDFRECEAEQKLSRQ